MEVITPGQGANGEVGTAPPATTIDSESLIQHLINLLELTLGASIDELESKGSLLSDAKRNDTIQRCLRFASESQLALYVQKDTIPAEASNGFPNGHDRSGERYALFAITIELTQANSAYYAITIFTVLRDLIIPHDSRFGGTDQAPAAPRFS